MALVADPATAGKDHCRTLMLDGSAGDTSTDSVTFRMVDETGGTVIVESCQVTVKSSEEAHELGARLPIQWYYAGGDLYAGPCLSDSEALALATKPNGKVKYPKKVCADPSGGLGPSCRIKFTYKEDKNTGLPKKGPKLEVCCYEDAECKHTKWGSSTDNPINLQVRNNSVAIDFLPAPASLPAAVGASSDLVVDPIGVEQLPFPAVSDCRATIAKDIEAIANRMASVLRACHLDSEVPDQSVCNAIGPASDPSASVATAATNLRQQVRDACAALGAPSKFSYTECPAPCAGFITPPACMGGPNDGLACRTDAECDSAHYCFEESAAPCSTNGDCVAVGGGDCVGGGLCLTTCNDSSECDSAPGSGDGKCVRKGDGVCKDRCALPAISAGLPCGVDAECDSAPGSGDGRCGDWGQVADCAACLTRAAVENSFQQAFGASGSPVNGLSPDAFKCKTGIATAMGLLQKSELKETRTCQARLDAAKTSLPPTTKKCKDADPKGKRAKAVQKGAALMSKICTDADVLELETCGIDLAATVQCTLAAVKTVNQAYGISAIPDSRCGDAKRIGEECDDGNTLNGDGCADDCTCEGTCGDGQLNPLAACGEICDDGNSAEGDGCDSNCTPTGCGNGILTPPEQCEADSDCPPGLRCDNACICAP